MGIQSMTGFAFAANSQKGLNTKVEIRSVNGRFCEIQFKTPKNLNFLEPQMRELIEKKLNRGTISISVQLNGISEQMTTVKVNEPMLKQVLDSLVKLQSNANLSGNIQLAHLLNLPEALIIDYREDAEKDIYDFFWPVFTKAIDEVVLFRQQEGAKLAQDMSSRTHKISLKLKEIESFLPERREGMEKKIRENLESLLKTAEVPLDKDRFWNECGLLAEKMDVSEEIVRFRSHLEVLIQILKSDSGQGKKMGFVLQELGREINTLSNKSLYSPIQHACVDIKEELEMLREQVQNIV